MKNKKNKLRGEFKMKQTPQPIQDLANQIFGDSNYKLYDWDLDRIYIERDNEEYTIRMWNITDETIRWTLFKDVPDEDGGSHGEEMDFGLFEYELEPQEEVYNNFSLEKFEYEMNQSKFVALVLDFLKDEILECDSCSEEYGITINLKDVNFVVSGVEWDTAIQEYLGTNGYHNVNFTFGDGNWTTIYKN
ncbi:hypothetical protein P9E34_14280 [Schinkia azotoformans]|uniref:hypothetical protein n=1 Tax=Schinkia azotoformans TaxID=1454 RepID=UPI002DBF9041|nr:hypothetical protein [Schinkia azotoformans]MEC1725882.1 hypothetical protein [Schinkia azotoformans]